MLSGPKGSKIAAFRIIFYCCLNICVSPQNLYVEILMPNVLALGRGAFERCLGHESGVLGNAIIAFIKKTPFYKKELFSPFYKSEVTGRRPPSPNQEMILTRHKICQCFDLGLPSLQNSETMRNDKFEVFLKCADIHACYHTLN